jgi:ACS family tartrate transporter-like MFS transporter
MAAAVGFIATSMLSSSVPSLLAITLALTGLICMQPAFFSLLSVYLSGPAATGGIALVIAVSSVGSSFVPTPRRLNPDEGTAEIPTVA